MSGRNLSTVVVISRHAQRYPVANINGLQEVDTNLLGKVTPHGIESMKNLGKMILDRYGAAFVDNCDLIVHHSWEKRCLVSVLAVVEALNKKPAAVLSNEDSELYQMTLVWDDFSGTEAESMIQCSNIISNKYNPKDNNAPIYAAMYMDTAFCHADLGYVLPTQVIDKMRIIMDTYLKFLTKLQSMAPSCLAAKAFEPIIHAANRSKPEIVLINTSDLQLFMLLQRLHQKGYTKRPEYGASLFFEIYDNGDVKIYFMEKQNAPLLELENCSAPSRNKYFIVFMDNLCSEIKNIR